MDCGARAVLPGVTVGVGAVKAAGKPFDLTLLITPVD